VIPFEVHNCGLQMKHAVRLVRIATE
jgi:hypothetical protein